MDGTPTTGSGDNGVPVYGSAYNKLRRVSCQITGQMARYERREEEKYSIFYCSMFFFLLSAFICGITMTAFGGMSFSSCSDSYIPLWLLVEGLIISSLFIVLFCGESKGAYYFKVILSSSLFLFLCVWSFLGILWSVLDTECSYELSTFSLILSVICALFVILGMVTWVYWCCKSLPCKGDEKQPQFNETEKAEQMLTILEEE